MAGCVEAQQLLTPGQAQEFVAAFPSQSKAVIVSKTIRWLAANTDYYTSLRIQRNPKVNGIDSMISDGAMDVWTDDSQTVLKAKYTLIVEVKDHKMRIKFANLRRWFGSANYDIRIYDPFFSTATGIQYQRKAQQNFDSLAERMTSFITFGN
jgi:hypothetical protein